MTPLPGFLLLLLAGVAVWSFVRLRRVAAIGAGYKAKVVCSIVFGTGRTIDPPAACALEEVSADSYRLLRLFGCRVDRDARAVSAALWRSPPRPFFFGATAGAPSAARAWPTAAAAPALER